MIDTEAIRQRNERAKDLAWESLEREVAAIYGASPWSDIDALLAEVERLRKDNAGVLADLEGCMEGL